MATPGAGQAVFAQIRPICLRLTTALSSSEHSVQSQTQPLRDLLLVVQSSPVAGLDACFEYLLLPLLALLKRGTPLQLELTMQTLTVLFLRCGAPQESQAAEVFLRLCTVGLSGADAAQAAAGAPPLLPLSEDALSAYVCLIYAIWAGDVMRRDPWPSGTAAGDIASVVLACDQRLRASALSKWSTSLSFASASASAALDLSAPPSLRRKRASAVARLLGAKSSRSTLGYAFSVLLAHLRVCKARHVVRCILAGVRVIVDRLVATKQADAVACFFPGIVASTAAITTQHNLGDAVAASAVDTCAFVIVSLLNDHVLASVDVGHATAKASEAVTLAELHKMSKKQSTSQSSAPSSPSADDSTRIGQPGPSRDQSLSVAVTQEWVRVAAQRLAPVMVRLFGAADGQYVDHAAAAAGIESAVIASARTFAASVLLITCSDSLLDTAPNLVHALILHCQADDPDVAAVATTSLRVYQLRVSASPHASRVMDLLQRNLQAALLSGQRRFRATAGDPQREAIVLQITGYLTVLRDELDVVFDSDPSLWAHITRFLVYALEFQLDATSLVVVENHSQEDAAVAHSIHAVARTASVYPRKHFAHFISRRVLSALDRLLAFLASNLPAHMVMDAFTPLLHAELSPATASASPSSSRQHRRDRVSVHASLPDVLSVVSTTPGRVSVLSDDGADSTSPLTGARCQAVYVLNALVRQQPQLVDQLLPLYQDRSIWHATLSTSPSPDTASFAALLLEGIGQMAEQQGKHFARHLRTSLYHVLDKVTATSPAVAAAAASTLQRMALATLPESDAVATDDLVSVLLLRNADYLVDTLVAQLRHLDLYPSAPLVLQAFLQQSGPAALPVTAAAVQAVLSGLDAHHTEHRSTFLRILHAIAVVLWNAAMQQPDNDDGDADDGDADAEAAAETGDGVDDDVDAKLSPRSYFLKRAEAKAKREASEAARKQKQQGAGPDAELEEMLSELEADASLMQQHDEQQAENEAGVNTAGLPDLAKTHVPSRSQQRVDLMTTIVRRTAHFVAAEDPRQQLAALRILQLGVLVLRSHSDILLPLIHDVWPAFSPRFAMRSPRPVVQQACYMLRVMAREMPNFVARRFSHDIWLRLQLQLASLSAHPALAHHTAAVSRPSSCPVPAIWQHILECRPAPRPCWKTATSGVIRAADGLAAWQEGGVLEGVEVPKAFATASPSDAFLIDILWTIAQVTPLRDFVDPVASDVAKAVWPFLHNGMPLHVQWLALLVFARLVDLEPRRLIPHLARMLDRQVSIPDPVEKTEVFEPLVVRNPVPRSQYRAVSEVLLDYALASMALH